MENDKMTAFIRLMKSAFSYAQRAKNCSFDDLEGSRKEDKCSALAYAAACTAKYSAAEAIYWTSPELEHYELPDLFVQFNEFVHEVQNDYETNHSRQWVAIEFDKLKDMFENSVCNLPIVE